MTVAELITELRKYPAKTNCLVYSIDSGEWIGLTSIRYEKDKHGKDTVYLITAFDTDT